MRATTVMLATIGLLLGCVQKSLLTTEIGTITGRIRPAGANALIYLEGTGDSTRCGDDGFFILPDVPHGDYNLIVEAEGFSHRERHHVVVVQAQLTFLGTIQLTTMPYPIVDVIPRDGDMDVSKNDYVYLVSDERLDLTTLQSFARLEPAVSGHWIEAETYTSTFTYVFSSDSGLEIASTYRLTIPVDIRTRDGQFLDRPIVTQFTTLPLTVSVNVAGAKFVHIDNLGAVAISNVPIDVDSLNKAFTIEPHLDARWFPAESYYQYPQLVLPVGVHAKPDTWYTIIISDQVALSGSLKLREPYVALFKTEGFGITSIEPHFNSYMFSNDTLSITLNLPADTASIERSISLVPHGGVSIPTNISWSLDRTMLRIVPHGGWTARTSYAVTVSPGARSEEGAALASEFVSYFFLLN